MTGDALGTLLERLAGDDVRAAERAFREYEPYLRKVVRRQLPARVRAKFDSIDVVQSVWADVVRGWPHAGWHFASAAQLRAFLIKMTRNRFIDRLRQCRRPLEREQPLENTDPAALPAREPRPSEVAEANELWDRLLALCPPAHREVLRLRREGLPVTEVAARTGLHEDSIHRILRTLARRLAVGRRSGAPADPHE